MRKNKKKKKMLGPVITIILLTFIIIVISTVFSLLQIDAEQTSIVKNSLETSVVTVNNILTRDGVKYILSNIVTNLQIFEPLVLLIISLITVGIGEASGIFKAIFKPLNRVNPKFLTFIVILIGIGSNFFGEYSYVFLLPLVAILYQSIGRKPLLGVLTIFIAITMGYATGFVYNNQEIVLGRLTQQAATLDVDKNFVYALNSNSYIMFVSTFILAFGGMFIIHNFLDKKVPKSTMPEDDEAIISKRALYYSNLAFVFMAIIIVYMIIPGLPGSGILLGDGNSYVERLLGTASPFYQGFTFIILGITMICSFIYGFLSGNIKNSNEYSVGLSKNFENLGYLFVLLFFVSQMVGILEWTNLGKVIACLLTTLVSSLPFTGLPLLVTFFIVVIFMTILIPSDTTKWGIISPLMVPLMMRSNIAPNFTQFVFRVGDGIGKSLTPFFAYYMITLAFLEKYNTKENVKITVFGTLRLLMPTLLLFVILFKKC
jgi:aminobenzoyl-glutamate transport protein